jgi:predicted kinase
MADVGFITMDLNEFNEPELSTSLLNQYLQYSGDYQGLIVLPYFQAYRAMVRAKVAMFRLQQELSSEELAHTHLRYKNCVAAALQYLQPATPTLIITCGVSASGKTTLAKMLADKLNLIHLISDIERKRQADIELSANCSDKVLQGLYSPEQTANTYQRLNDLSQLCLQAGNGVIVDATFRSQAQRNNFAKLAQTLNVPFIIVHCDSPETALRERLHHRQQGKPHLSEATQDVLSMQLKKFETLSSEELSQSLKIDSSKPLEFATMLNNINELIYHQLEDPSEISEKA